MRQNYHEDCEKGINQQINLELYAFYTYTSMVSLHLTSHFLPSFPRDNAHVSIYYNFQGM